MARTTRTATAGRVTADLLIRYSDLREEDLGPDGKARNIEWAERTLKGRARQLGWTVGKVIIENDMIDGRPKPASAWKRRKVTLADGSTVLRVYRPAFRELLDRLLSGKSEAMLSLDLDRTARDPRDLEDLIDVVREVRANCRSISGSLTFTDGGTDAEIMIARVMVAMANKSSADTSRRVKDLRRRQAEAGMFGGGRRPYGFERNGVEPIEEECEVIRVVAESVLAGVSLRDAARSLTECGVPTPGGAGRWSSPTLRDILLRPRNAGHMVSRGEVIEGAAPWAPVISDDVWRAVVGKLTDPNRVSPPGRASGYLGSGIYTCHCGQVVNVRAGTKKAPAYRCRKDERGGAHVLRNVEAVDRIVTTLAIGYVKLPKVQARLDAMANEGVDLGALRAEVKAITDRKQDLIDLHSEGVVDRAGLARGMRDLDAKLTEAQEQLDAQTAVVSWAGLARSADPEAVWSRTSLADKRAIIRDLMRVSIKPARSRVFNPEDVEITWND